MVSIPENPLKAPSNLWQEIDRGSRSLVASLGRIDRSASVERAFLPVGEYSEAALKVIGEMFGAKGYVVKRNEDNTKLIVDFE